MMSHIGIGRAFSACMVVAQSDANHDAMKRFLLPLWVREIKFFHALTNTARAFARHPHIAKITERIHQMMVARSTNLINCFLINRRHEAARTFNFHSIWKELYENLGSAEVIRAVYERIDYGFKPCIWRIFRRCYEFSLIG